MTNAAPHSDHHGEPRDAADVVYDRLLRVQQYVETRWRELVVFSVAVVAALSLAVGLRQYRVGRGTVAAEALFAAETTEEAAASREALAAVARDYPRTGAALQAAFTGAQLAFEAEEYAEARAVYERILAAQPYSPLAPAAALGAAIAAEAAGDVDAAVAAYQSALTAYPNAYTRPQAQLALGRLAETRGDTTTALAQYRAIVSANPGTVWERQASERIAVLAPAPAPAPAEQPADALPTVGVATP